MFVYNGCVADARVLKEATTLVQAGHRVEIVAVLVRDTEPVEERPEGFRIVRIERNPPHYRLLRRSRRVRRWMRLNWARTKRAMRNRRRRLDRKVAPVRRRLEARAVRAPRPVPGWLRRAGRALGRPYRAARWRLLRAAPRQVRRHYYRRRRVHAARGRRPAWAILLLPALAAAYVVRGIPRASRWIERRLSHACYRAVMTVHKPLMFCDYYRRAARHARAGGFATFHAHDLNTLPAAVLAGRRGGRVVYDAHELYCEISTLSPREKLVWRVVERLLIRRADAVLTVCESIAGELSRRYSIRKPAIVLNCPPASAYPWRGDDGVLRRKAGLTGSDEPIVLYQGGLAPNRGLHELIHAARYLQRGVLVLMGSGRLRDELAALIGRLRLTGRVVMTDAVAQHELLSYTVGADVGVIPYRAIGLNNTYTTPNKLFEYLAAGLAVAGSRLPELRRVIDGHELGLTFDPDDPRDIGMALNFLLDPAAPLAEMRANARTAAELYVWERQTDELLAVHPSAARSRLAVPARAL